MANFWIREYNGQNTLGGLEDSDKPPVLPLYIIAEFLQENQKAREDFNEAYMLLSAEEKSRLDEMVRLNPRVLLGDKEPQKIEDEFQTKLNDVRVNLPNTRARTIKTSGPKVRI